MATVRGVRARARAEITEAITTEARRQLAETGADGLSLRAVARALGMVSSAVYRYVASRDELLTLLIVEAYDAVGEAAEQAARRCADRSPAARWVATAEAIRAWAVAHPHEYALVYGTPVPGYQAPEDTIGPAGRAPLAMIGIVAETWSHGALLPGASTVDDIPGLADDLRHTAEQLAPGLPPDVLARVFAGITQSFGLISFELFGQSHNVVQLHAELFRATADAMAAFIGLPA